MAIQAAGSPVSRRPAVWLKARNITGGVPIGAKIGAGKYLEKDLNTCAPVV